VTDLDDVDPGKSNAKLRQKLDQLPVGLFFSPSPAPLRNTRDKSS
jgi:hypothetical protein